MELFLGKTYTEEDSHGAVLFRYFSLPHDRRQLLKGIKIRDEPHQLPQ